MPFPPPLQRLVDEELRQAVPLIEQVMQTMSRTPAMSDGERETLRGMLQHRATLSQRFAQALREEVMGVAAKAVAAPQPSATPLKLSLSLVDEDEVAADVELSRAIEAINSVAEYELRELGAFTAALVGDEDVARQSNPLKAEVYARALCAAARELPMSRRHQIAFIRLASTPLAQAVRMASAAACSRLESQGIEPSMYRTIVRHPGTRGARPGEQASAPHTDLHGLRDSMPVPLDPLPTKTQPLDEVLLRADEMLRLLPDDAGVRTHMQTMDAQHSKLLSSAGSRVDQQMIELLSRLFDAILADPTVPPAVQVLLSRLHASALRVALREPETLDTYSHPVWLFMDRLAFESETHGGEHSPALATVLRHAQALIDHIAREPLQDAALYQWGLDRLVAYEKNRFQQRCQNASSQIDMLQRYDDTPDRAPSSTSPAPQTTLDIGTLDTVPADLMSSDPPAPDNGAAQWLRDVPAGEWLQIFMQGRWQVAQLLWRSDSNGVWLLCDAGSDDVTWAVRQPALERLHAENLLVPLAPRSLVQQAAEKVLRQIVEPDDAN